MIRMVKITRNGKEEFEPITIVLTKKYEAEVLRSLVGGCSGEGIIREFIDEVFDALRRYAILEKL